MAALEASFERLTGGKPVRHGGLAYAGRTLLYEDRRRNVEVTLGPDWARDLGPPLALVLRSAAWYVSAIGAELEVHLERAFEECAKRVSGGPVWLEHLMFNAANSRAGAAIVRTAAAAVNERWMSILNVDEGARRVEVTAQTLRDRVLAGFPESAPPWPSARYHSPDVLIAADGVESLLNGRFRFVLGEVHAESNTAMQPLFAATHPRPHDLARLVAEDIGRPPIHQVIPRNHPGARVAPGSLDPDDYHVAVDDAPSWRAEHRVLPVGNLIVEEGSEGLIVVNRATGQRFHISEFLRSVIGHLCATSFSLLQPLPHAPRIQVDKRVVLREMWCIPCGDMEFAFAKTSADRFVEARRWMRLHALPRWVFVRLPYERKPIYLDFCSSISVDGASKLIRKGAVDNPRTVLTVTEMLPNPGECWLTDAEGNRYSSELRLVAVDPTPWPFTEPSLAALAGRATSRPHLGRVRSPSI